MPDLGATVRQHPLARAAGGGDWLTHLVSRLLASGPRSDDDHLDVNYARVTNVRPRQLARTVHDRACQWLCAPVLYVLLYRADAYLPGQFDRTLTGLALSSGVGFFVPKPTRDVAYHHCYSA